jgi:aryl-alcohol dehydrogenase-like predicted oxidoreductase
MQTRRLGKSDIAITSIIMGTWQTGKSMWTGIEDNQSIKALRSAFDAGITTIDTAEAYGNGHSERVIAKALGDMRHEVVYATKVFPNHYRSEQVIAACERSLNNLKTDYIDLYQLHWPSGSFNTPQVELEETMAAMNTLVKQGKIRAIGVSNFSAEQIEEASKLGRIDSLQPPYSLLWRHVESDAQPYCTANDITLLAYSPMAQGLLTGKFGADHQFEDGDHRSRNKLFQPDHFRRVQAVLAEIQPIADQRDLSLAQLALAWVCNQPNACAIAGARNAQQVIENAKAGDIRLSEDELAAMDEASRIVVEQLDDDPVLWQW